MAEAKRRGYGEDGIYFGHRGDCRDGAHHKTCSGRRRGVVSLGFDASGKRIRKKVSDPTRTEVKDKLKALHSELTRASGPSRGYTVEGAVADWLAGGLPGRAAKTVEVYRKARRISADAGGSTRCNVVAPAPIAAESGSGQRPAWPGPGTYLGKQRFPDAFD
jgi:hypothetical protein